MPERIEHFQEALKIAIQARQWDIGEMVCKERPELSPELTTARTMATDNIEVEIAVLPAADAEL